MSAINVDLVSDAKSAVMGAKQTADALEGIADTLDDVVRDVQKNTGRMADTLVKDTRDGVTDSQGHVEKLERTFADLARETKQETKKVSKALAEDTDDGTHKASQSVEEFKGEAKANFAETASSFDGSMESIVGMAQGTFGGLAGALGPAGMLGAGVLGAVIGTAAGMVTAWQEKQAAIKQGFSDMWSEASAAGRLFLDSEQINAEVLRIMHDEDQGRYNNAKADAERLGLSLSTILRAEAGDREAINEAMDKAKELQDGINTNLTVTNDAEAAHLDTLLHLKAELGGAVSHFREIRDMQDQNAQKAQLYQEIEKGTGKVISDNLSLAKQRVDELSKPITITVRPQVDSTAYDAWMQKTMKQGVNVNAYVNLPRTGGPIP